MKISIVTVCFNSAATVVDTLASVAEQTHADIEHIVIDGASSDDTLALVRRHGAHVAQIVSEPDQGIYDAMNKGLNLATGDVIGFLNSDDMLADPQSVAVIASAFEAPGVDAVFGDIVLVDPVHLERVRRYWRPGPHVPGSLLKGWMAPHPTLYVRRPILQSSGGFDLTYRLQSDFDLEVRLFELMRVRSQYIPHTLVRMRLGGATTGSWRNVVRGNLEAEHSARSHGFPAGWPFVLRKILSRVPQFFERESNGNALAAGEHDPKTQRDMNV